MKIGRGGNGREIGGRPFDGLRVVRSRNSFGASERTEDLAGFVLAGSGGAWELGLKGGNLARGVGRGCRYSPAVLTFAMLELIVLRAPMVLAVDEVQGGDQPPQRHHPKQELGDFIVTSMHSRNPSDDPLPATRQRRRIRIDR